MSQNQIKILVVDDDLFLRELYVETLTSEGYQVESAVDGEEALNKIKQGGWDLVLLDIIMPKMDGLEVMRAVNASGPLPAPNKGVVFLTNLDNPEEIKTALQLGKGYIIKSQVTPAELLVKVKGYLEPSSSSSTPPPAAQPPTQ